MRDFCSPKYQLIQIRDPIFDQYKNEKNEEIYTPMIIQDRMPENQRARKRSKDLR